MAFGALLGQTASGGGGKRVCRFTVGTSTAGWTANDCDYLCDGTADDVEINAAIQALPAEGGEIVILDGTYNITATIAMNKDNVTLSGNGSSTVLKRMYNSLESIGIVTVSSNNCIVQKFYFDGNKTSYDGTYNVSVKLSSCTNTIIKENVCYNIEYSSISLSSSQNNIIINNICRNSKIGIYIGSSSNNVIANNVNSNNSYGINIITSKDNNITSNTCNDNDNCGIDVAFSDNNNITGNTCNNNKISIRLSTSDNNNITGNTCIRGTGTPSDYKSDQYTIYLQNTSNNYNLISSNNIMGKDYVSDGGTNNTFVNNKYN